MGKLQRIGVIIVSIAIIVACGFRLLAYSTVPFIVGIVNYLHSLAWFSIAACIVLIIIMLGAIALLVYAIKAPSNLTHLVIKRDGGNVDVSTTAIKSVIRHVIARHSLIKLESIRIQVRHSNNPALKIKVRINPGRQVQLDELGLALQEEIADTVEKFCGGIVQSVNIVFTSADNSAVGSGKTSFGSSSSKFTPVNTAAKSNSVATITVEDVEPVEEKKQPPALPSPASSTAQSSSSASSTASPSEETDPSSTNSSGKNPIASADNVKIENEPTLGSKVSKFFKRNFGANDSSNDAN